MDLETHKKIIERRKEINNNYILEKIKSIRNSENTKNITADEEKLIIDSYFLIFFNSFQLLLKEYKHFNLLLYDSSKIANLIIKFLSVGYILLFLYASV